MAVGTYIVAVRRDQRHAVPEDWLERLEATEGVTVLGATSGRARIEADAEGVRRLRVGLGAYLHIEPIIEHRPS
jgi:uncharacterized protein YcgL (UPF0745 family)